MFYVIEGPDGAGKTTLLANVRKRLEGLGKKVLQVKFPGETPIGASIRQLMLHDQKNMPEPFSRDAQVMLMVSDMHLTGHTIIKPAILRGEIVLADRYYLSTMVYQYGDIFSRQPAHEAQVSMFLQGGVFRGLLPPERTFLISAAKEIVHQRLQERHGGKDFFEDAWEKRHSIYCNAPISIDGQLRELMNLSVITQENNSEVDLELIAAQIANTIYIDTTPERFNAVG